MHKLKNFWKRVVIRAICRHNPVYFLGALRAGGVTALLLHPPLQSDEADAGHKIRFWLIRVKFPEKSYFSCRCCKTGRIAQASIIYNTSETPFLFSLRTTIHMISTVLSCYHTSRLSHDGPASSRWNRSCDYVCQTELQLCINHEGWPRHISTMQDYIKAYRYSCHDSEFVRNPWFDS